MLHHFNHKRSLSCLDQFLINCVILAVCTQGQKEKKINQTNPHTQTRCNCCAFKMKSLVSLPCVGEHQIHLDM